MLTPVFRCRTESTGKFILVDIRLPSIHCKVSAAEFDITNNQFTFHCNPYYLRLTFSHWLTQGQGEKATYDVEENVLTVYLPKLNPEDQFIDLEIPAKLLATRRQRKQRMVMEIEQAEQEARNQGGDVSALVAAASPPEQVVPRDQDDRQAERDEADRDQEQNEDEDEEEEEGDEIPLSAEEFAEDETEFVQKVPKSWDEDLQERKKHQYSSPASVGDASNRTLPSSFNLGPKYGFNYNFSGYFSKNTAAAIPSTGISERTVASSASGGSNDDEGEGDDLKAKIKRLSHDGDDREAASAAFKSLPFPDEVDYFDRRVQRMAEEESAFDEDMVFFYTFFDEGRAEVEELLHGGRKPWYLKAFETALKREGVSFLSKGETEPTTVDGIQSGREHQTERDDLEEDSTPFISGHAVGNNPRVVVAWEGNVGTLSSAQQEGTNSSSTNPPASPPSVEGVRKPLVQVLASFDHDDNGETTTTTQGGNTSRFVRRRDEPIAGTANLACPKVKPSVDLTLEESDLLAKVPLDTQQSVHAGGGNSSRSSSSQQLAAQQKKKSILPSVRSLIFELLCSYVYDQYVTQGEGSTESLWNITQLSSSCSWLDTDFHLYDACRTFARRALCFPQYRSYDLISRCFRDVGVILLCGRVTVLKCLLRVKELLDHSSSQFCLSVLFINPLLSHLCTSKEESINAAFEQMAVELHDYVAVGGRPGVEDDGDNASSKMQISRPSRQAILSWTGGSSSKEDKSAEAGSGGVERLLREEAAKETEVVMVDPVGLPALGLPFSAI